MGLGAGPPDWKGLSLCLAEAYVSGFHVADAVQTRGRPKASNRHKLDVLVGDMDALTAKHTVSHAARLLSNQKKGPHSGRSPKTLENLYRQRKAEISGLKQTAAEFLAGLEPDGSPDAPEK